MSLRDEALKYGELGWAIFPITPGEKAPPLVSDFPERATSDAKQIKEWWDRWPDANIGFVPGKSNMMVVDIDKGADISGLDLPPTKVKAETPSGGQHLVYELDGEEVVPPSVGKIAENVDIRSDRSYILIEPSVVSNGEYHWERHPEEAQPTYRPDWIVEAAAKSKREKAEDRDEWQIEPDVPHNVERAIRWLREDAAVSVRGQGGDNTAYATAAHLRSLGISQGLALELMWDHWNTREGNEWSWDKLELKVDNAYRYATDPPGNFTREFKALHDKSLFQKLKSEEPKEEEANGTWYSGPFRFTPMSALMELEPPSWIVEDFIPDDAYVLLVGAKDSYKTFVTLDIVLGLIHHRDQWPAPGFWGNRIRGSPGPVLYAVGEGRQSLGKRIAAWQQYYLPQRLDRELIMADPVPGSDSVNSERFEKFIIGAKNKHEKYGLTVIDTVGRSMQGVNEDAQENASNFTRLADTIRGELGGSVLAIHHSGHNNERARGSSVFGADPDTIIFADTAGRRRIVNLKMQKQKDAERWEKDVVVGFEKIQIGGDPRLTSLVAREPTEQELLMNPKDPLDWLNDLVLEKLDEWGGKKITQSEMLTYLSVKSGMGLDETRGWVAKLIHSSLPAAQRYRDGGWQS